MIIGRMHDRIVIKSPTEAYSPSGETTLSWETFAEVWASVEGLSSRDLLQAQQANVIATHRIRIRHLDGVTHLQRVEYRGKTMEIASVTDRDNRTMLELLAREVA
jgi:SPP1 family predicted phage head-tail adaptor